jgi:hypothetical protein
MPCAPFVEELEVKLEVPCCSCSVPVTSLPPPTLLADRLLLILELGDVGCVDLGRRFCRWKSPFCMSSFGW